MDLNAPPVDVSTIPEGYRLTFRAPIQMDTSGIEDDLERVILARPKRIEVDLSPTDHLSTVGLGLLISLNHRITGFGGRLVIIRLRKKTRGVLKITRLDHVLQIEPNAIVDDASA